MNSPFHLTVRRALKQMASSCEPASADGHSRTPKESAHSAPIAPYKSECRTAFGERRTKFRRAISNGYALKGLRPSTCDRQNFALKAASSELNSVGKTASARAFRKQFSGRVWSIQVGELNPSAGTRRALGIVQCLRQPIPEHEIRAQLQFHLLVTDPRSFRALPTARHIQRTIDFLHLTDAPQWPLEPVQNLRQRSQSRA